MHRNNTQQTLVDTITASKLFDLIINNKIQDYCKQYHTNPPKNRDNPWSVIAPFVLANPKLCCFNCKRKITRVEVYQYVNPKSDGGKGFTHINFRLFIKKTAVCTMTFNEKNYLKNNKKNHTLDHMLLCKTCNNKKSPTKVRILHIQHMLEEEFYV